ncbi:MAG: hypothetical protein EA392_11205 [Cryomorphaceae bacterium]|nr:MAG: hypothetical protein EA392_11205 [Cryomorphaceae bacterium]
MMSKMKVMEVEALDIKGQINNLRAFVAEEFIKDPNLIEITVRYTYFLALEGDLRIAERVFHRDADDWVHEKVLAYMPDRDARVIDVDVFTSDVYLDDAWELMEWSDEFLLYAA